MIKYDSFTVGTADYKDNFWNKVMKGNVPARNLIQKGASSDDMFVIPYDSNRKYMDALKNECVFRKIATSIKSVDSDLDIWVSDSEDPAEWAQVDAAKAINEVINEFTKAKIKCHKLAVIDRLDYEFIRDMKISMEDFLTKRFAKRFGKAEENAFVNGTGVDMPTGILHNTDGAQVGATTSTLNYDDVISLYFSLKPEYRTKGVWLMNDETAHKLRTLKDTDGNYIWNHANDTIMSRPVYICNAMPSTGKVIAFGDFSYYWIINRMPISVRALTEVYSLNGQIGYLAHEYLDAKLIRPEAVKVLEVK